MKTYFDCLPCMIRQAVATALTKSAGLDVGTGAASTTRKLQVSSPEGIK